jgi:hypothetical protein
MLAILKDTSLYFTFNFRNAEGVKNKISSKDWIQLAQDRDRWQAVVSVVMNLRVLAPWS